ncbi:MAG: hypothetical protein QG656_1666 [Candidatus Hydrogenedentes bacterium]|nr:hypothetical protein [Candidatus Hydrogenedentota bacterium]
MARKSNNIGVLQFSEHEMTWLRAAPSSGGVRVLDFVVERGSWSAESGALEKALSAFVRRCKAAEDTVYTVLPRHEMTARILTLPSQDDTEIAGMIRLSAEEFVPYAADELVIDHAILASLSNGESRVLAVLAHRDVVESHLHLVRAAGIEPEGILLSSACLASAVLAARPDSADRIAVVNLASGGLEAIVIHRGRLDYDRGIASAQDWSLEQGPSEAVIEELGEEVGASLAAYRRESEDGGRPETVYLSSDWADVRVPAEMLSASATYACSPAWFARDLVAKGLEQVETLPLVALGAVLTAQDQARVVINLVPRNVMQNRALASVKRTALKVALLLAILGASLGGLYFQAIQQRQAIIDDLDARIGQIETDAKGIVAKQQQLQILQRQVERKGTFLELLAAVCSLAPEDGLNINRIAFQHGQEFSIYGRAKMITEIDKLAQALRDLGETTYPQFAKATTLYRNEAYERNEQVYDYGIGIEFPEEIELEPGK